MLREAAFDNLVKAVVLFACQEAQPTNTLAAVADLPGGIDGCLIVVDALAVTEGDECFVSVCGCGRLAVGAEPAFKFLRCNFSGGSRSERFADDLGLTDIAAAILMIDYEL